MIKRLLVSLLLLVLHANAHLHAQDTLRENKGAYWVWTILHSNSSLRERIEIKNGLRHGFYQKFQNDRIVESAHYAKGHLAGEMRRYSPPGQLSERLYYAYNPNSKQAEKHGLYEQYHQTLRVLSGQYKNNQKHGTWKSYHSSGQISEVQTFDNGQEAGPYAAYYPSGKRRIKATAHSYLDAKGNRQKKWIGKFVSYYENGQKQNEGTYDSIGKVGIWKDYFQNGQLQSRIAYRQNLPYGEAKTYYANGQLASEYTIYQERVVPNGNTLQRWEGHYRTYFENGHLKEQRQYANNLLNGEWTLGYEHGQLKERRFYKDGLLTGVQETFEPDGKRRMQTHWEIKSTNKGVESVKNGIEQSWKNGQLLQTSTYVDGQLEGEVRTYYPNGELQQLRTFTRGQLNGLYQDFTPNGVCVRESHYALRSTDGDKLASAEKGWVIAKNEQGQLTSQMFYNALFERTIHLHYEFGNLLYAQWDKLFAYQLYPNGSLKYFQLLDNNNYPYLGYYFTLDGKLRKLSYMDPTRYTQRVVELNPKGEISSQYNPNQSKSESVTLELSKKIIEKTNSAWTTHAMFSTDEATKSGPYRLLLNNQKTAVHFELEQFVPHGSFFVFDPISGDTLVKKTFRQGVLVGDYYAKRAPELYYDKGIRSSEGKPIRQISYHPNGTVYQDQLFSAEGSRQTQHEFYANGQVKRTYNPAGEMTAEYTEKGHLLYLNEPISKDANWQVRKEFYPDSPQVKIVRYYYQQLQDSTATTYFENGNVLTEIQFRRGQRHGTYQQWDAEKNLVRSGHYVADQMHGEWIDYRQNPIQMDTYVYGKLQTLPPSTPCGCQDTELASGSIKFVPSLSSLLEWKKLSKQLPTSIQAVDEFNYSSLFYRHFQFSNGTQSGFSSLELLTFSELAFHYVSEKTLRISLNPCRVRGYLTAIPITASYIYGDESATRIRMEVPRIEVRLPESPLKNRQGEPFTAIFKTSALEWNANQQLQIAVQDAGCFPEAKIHALLTFSFEAGELILNQTAYPKEAVFGSKSHQPYREDGLRFTKGQFTLQHQSQELKGEIEEVRATNQQVYARGILSNAKATTTGYAVEQAGQEKTIHLEKLQQEWAKTGHRLTWKYDESLHTLALEWYAK